MKIKQTGGIKKKRAGVTSKAVCFTCRKCFHSHIPHCVECKGIIHVVGNFFTAPKKTDTKEWKLLEKMVVQAHYRFSKYGASGVMPESIRHADKIIMSKIRQQEPHIYKRKNIKDITGKLIPEKFNYLGE